MVKIGGISWVVLLALVISGCFKKPSVKEQEHSAPLSVQTQGTEQAWLAKTVVTDLVRLAACAGGKASS
jgi:hypothetical protein